MNPLLWTLRWLWQANPAVREALAAKLRETTIANPYLAAKFYPYQSERTSYLVETTGDACGSDTALPVPPRELWWGYGDTEEQYLAAGRWAVESMAYVLEAAGTPLRSYGSILDFGCGSGIMVRWLLEYARTGEVWGVDISGEHILWCQRHLSPPFRFVTTTSSPHLPFEDRHFDFVYAGSVFTHIADLAEAWLLELKRIVRPGGRLYLTVSDERSIELYLTQGDNPFLARLLRAYDEESHFTSREFDFFTVDRTPGGGAQGQAQVFYRSDYLRQHWSQYLTIVSVTPRQYGGQTAVLLEK